MQYVFKNDVFSYMALGCAILLLLATLPMPGIYYDFLRICICLIAIVLMIKEYKVLLVLWCFALVAYLFNPFAPVYLYQKALWQPVDIICALLFVSYAFKTKKKKSYVPYSRNKKNTSYGRDKMY
ncbi:DUF6804 family protein [Muriicola sp. Z0-33]|uniref:DUF6804 family protein n=1 Tax=Muriicola sp. Z0-33 TaxID=2816957 RepID=UPI002237590F|nr:DUF6804 family protein [Muriicola sp. Z0-33]MCW5516922.1 hypothetical protein [Muriicola sp. Z0-33]